MPAVDEPEREGERETDPAPLLDADALEPGGGDLSADASPELRSAVVSALDDLPDELTGADRRGLLAAWFDLRLRRNASATELRHAADEVVGGALEQQVGSVAEWWSSSGDGGYASTYFRMLPAVVPPASSSGRGWRFSVAAKREWVAARPDPVTLDDDDFRAPLVRTRADHLADLRGDDETPHAATGPMNPLHASVANCYDHVVRHGEASVAELVERYFRPSDRSYADAGHYTDAGRWCREVLRPSLASGAFPGLSLPRTLGRGGGGDTIRFVGVSPSEVGTSRSTSSSLENPPVDGKGEYADPRADAYRSAFQQVVENGSATTADLASSVNRVRVGYGSATAFVENEVGPWLAGLEEIIRDADDDRTVYRFDYHGIDENKRIEHRDPPKYRDDEGDGGAGDAR